MSQDVNTHKIDEKQKREAEHLATKLMHEGVGHDEAKKRALEQVAAASIPGGHNGGGGDPPKKADQHRPHNAEEQTGGPK